MASVIAAMYRDRSTAETVVSELKDSGGPDRKVHLISTTNASDLDRTGIPSHARTQYQQGLMNGLSLVAVRAEDDAVDDAEAIMNRHDPIEDLGQDTASGSATVAGQTQRAAQAGGGKRGDQTVEVVEEQLRVGKRQVESGGVRVTKHVVETPVEEEVDLHQERVRVERRPVDREVAAGDHAFEEQTIEARETSEEAVVQKTARVVEEIVIRREGEDRTETVRDTVRRTDVDVEQLEGAFRQDAQNRFGDEYSYDQVEPAYRFGRDFAECEECQDKSWTDVSDDARTRFEERNPGTWDRFGPAVEHAYNRTRTAGR